MQKSGKLELTWVGKYEQKEIEPRILVENPDLSYGDQDTGNMLIHGDNLIALKALEQDYAGKIKCIYIDPPYNTGSAFEYYDDGLEHSEWLNMMRPRLEILQRLLSDNGAIFISIDDDEFAYLKVLCDEVFGRVNFVGTLIWEKKKKPSFLSNIGSITEYILVYAKEKMQLPDLVYGVTTEGKKYPFNNAGNGIKVLTFPPKSVSFLFDDCVIQPQDMSGGNIVTELLDEITVKDGMNEKAFRLKGEWRYSQQKLEEIVANKERIVISKIPFRPNHVKSGGEPKKLKNLLSVSHYGIATNEDATSESRLLFGTVEAFSYPKPEMLLSILIGAITNKDDLVLDSFLGSGTTAAVAHKMERRWIGIELGNHAYTHCKVRMDKVIDGEQGGISKAVNWQGGGGYKFYELAPSLLVPNPKLPTIKQINPEYTFAMMCEAICKLEGFKYKPDGKFHGKSSEQRFIHITKEFVNGEYINSLLANLGEGQSLLVYGTKIQSGLRLPDNVVVKKIPKDLLDKCAFESEVK